ncbi:MAG: hypothetical protein WKF37_05415 [Bryobacteraceae bacterium]
MPGEHNLVIQMHELLMYLNQKGVATFMVLAQAGVLGASMRTPVDLSYLADNVLLLRYFEAGGRVRKAVSVMKKRSGRHEDAIRELTFAPDSISWVTRWSNSAECCQVFRPTSVCPRRRPRT